METHQIKQKTNPFSNVRFREPQHIVIVFIGTMNRYHNAWNKWYQQKYNTEKRKVEQSNKSESREAENMITARLYINGKCVEGEGKTIEVVSPATGQVIGSFRAASIAQAEEALQAAKKAFKTWPFLSLHERITWMQKLGEALKKHKDEIVETLMLEAGKNSGGAAGGPEKRRVYDADHPGRCNR